MGRDWGNCVLTVDCVRGNEHPNIKRSYACDQWQAFWTWHRTDVFRNIYIFSNIKASHASLYCMEQRNKQHRPMCVRYNCGLSAANFPSMCWPHRWTVWIGWLPLSLRETAQCSIGPVANSSCTFQIQLKISVQLLQYHGLTASL